jgi:pimeloyl-ACP methyl ester carboxylesterase
VSALGAFAIERAAVRGTEIAFVRQGAGGFPLVLLHGWPETKRIWWRNIAPPGLDTPAKRRGYVAGMYGHRFWAAPGAFEPEQVDFMTEPFGDAERFRTSIALYEHALGAREASEPPRFLERNPTPTLVLYGPEDHVIPPSFPQRMQVALPEHIGPFVVEGAGHFLQWEAAGVLNYALRYFCADLLARRDR